MPKVEPFRIAGLSFRCEMFPCLPKQVDPNFYGMNLLMIARIFVETGDKVQAKKYAQLAADFTKENLSDDDREAIEEGKKLLPTL